MSFTLFISQIRLRIILILMNVKSGEK